MRHTQGRRKLFVNSRLPPQSPPIEGSKLQNLHRDKSPVMDSCALGACEVHSIWRLRRHICRNAHRIGDWCGRGDSNPHGQSPTDFLTIYGFRRPALTRSAQEHVRGLDYPFALARFLALGAARLVSTPSPPSVHSDGAWFGIGKADTSPAVAFPEFEQFYSCRFQQGTQRLA